MTTKTIDRSHQKPHHYLWRIALVFLVVLPFLPEIAIYGVSMLARLGDCALDDAKWVCLIADIRVSQLIDVALQGGLFVSEGFGVGGVAIWLALCYYVVTRGWVRTMSRLVLAFVLFVIFAILPYVAPSLALASLGNAQCQPNEGGVGVCLVFGGDMSRTAYDVVMTQDPILWGAPVAAGIFLVYTIFAIVIRVVSWRASATQPKQSSASQPK